MKKSITMILSIIVVISIMVGVAYLVDKKRMDNNEPVVFSTWGYDYAPPVKHENITHEIPEVSNENKTVSIPLKENEDLFVDLLDGWQYEISEEESDRYEYAINFFRSDKSDKMTLYAYNDRFGVCGTGLEVKDITLDDGNTVSVGFYDGSQKWSYITFGNDIVMQNEGLSLEESNEALSMIKTIKFVRKLPGNIAVMQRSFIGTIIEEEPTYLIVEPKDGELEKEQSNTKKILIPNEEYRDYIYGVGRKVIITYDAFIQDDNNTIIGADIDVDGYDDFEIEVVESAKIEKRKILNNKDLDKLNTNYDLWYYGLEEVNVKVNNKEMTLVNALKEGYLTMSGMLVKANKDINARINGEKYSYPYEVRLEDGGSVEFHYENFVIIKCNTLAGNNGMYICKAGTSINDLKI